MKQEVHPAIMAAIIVVVVVVIGYFGWKSLAKKGSGSGTGSSPYSNYKGPIPGQNGAGSGGMKGPGGPGSGGPGGMSSGGSGGAPSTGG